MYIVDTSAFIFYSRSYPPDIDIRKWEFIGHLIKKGKLISNSIVRKEISKYGEHLLTNEDTKYKEELGKIWEKLSNGKTHFFLVSNGNIEEVLNKIKEL